MTLEAAAKALRGLAGPDSPGRVDLVRTGDVAELVLAHPRARQALSARMMADLADAVLSLRDDPPAAVLLRASEPGAFCAGGYLPEVSASLTRPENGRVMGEGMATVLDELMSGPFLSVAVMEGPAIGGGAELALSTDFRVWAATGRLEFRQAALGVATGWGGAARLVRLVGRTRALRALAWAAQMGPEEAGHCGLADLVVDTDAVAAARAWLQGALANGVGPLAACKRQVVAAERSDKSAALDAFLAVWGGAIHRQHLDRSGPKKGR
jgi:ethylmalonyl-CoA/methylmalonyl-CoA decarboxylase